MPTDEDMIALVKALMVTAEAMGDSLSANAAAMMADDLSDYPVAVTYRALKTVRQECKGRLSLSDILKRVQASDGFPGTNEAWALAMRANDESHTVVWCDEIAMAFNIASPILEARDKVGARVAFIESYERIVKAAREAGKKPAWFASLGYDATQRDQALKDAVEAGRLSSEYAQGLLPAPMSEQAKNIAGLLGYTGEKVGMPEHIEKKLEELKREFRRSRTDDLQRFQDCVISKRAEIDKEKEYVQSIVDGGA